jgi:hypothetical protein
MQIGEKTGKIKGLLVVLLFSVSVHAQKDTTKPLETVPMFSYADIQNILLEASKKVEVGVYLQQQQFIAEWWGKVKAQIEKQKPPSGKK